MPASRLPGAMWGRAMRWAARRRRAQGRRGREGVKVPRDTSEGSDAAAPSSAHPCREWGSSLWHTIATFATGFFFFLY